MDATPKARIKAAAGAGKGCAGIFLFFSFAVGLLFFGFIVRSVYDTGLTYTWPRTDCDILESEGRVDPSVSDEDPPYRVEVAYRYVRTGVWHTPRESSNFSDWAKAARLRNSCWAKAT